ncbi:hypothetical protein MSAN_00226400 [Mycena sanguinolenta]|uniref:Uncharacterized protein n=1 Tax=Mycena sanguinolenta TaxID=230812 RepID=A0A8H7DL02_9AGAR|nr:hypothetical protein MSAN_00226400 [Mycena sanguinolenta]
MQNLLRWRGVKPRRQMIPFLLIVHLWKVQVKTSCRSWKLDDSDDEEETDVDNNPVQVPLADCMDPVNLAHSGVDRVLNQLNYTHFPALRRAVAFLTIKSKDKTFDVFFRARITAMVGILNLYLDPELSYTWREASMIVAKSQGHGSYCARSIQSWLHTFLTSKKLPLHRYGQYHSSILNDEDFADSIKLYLQSVSRKEGHFKAQDLVDFVASPEMQDRLEEAGIRKRSISVWTARRWLKRLDWRYGHRKNGMYIDGHEWEDVVAYRTAFVKRWLEEYEPRMVVYDNDGKPVKNPEGYVLTGKYKGQPFRIILVTHNESTFYANASGKPLFTDSDESGPN